MQHYSGATSPKATPDADEDDDTVVAPDDYTGGSGATTVPNTMARSSTAYERSRTLEETPGKAAVFKAAAAAAAAARGDAGGGRGKDEGETGCGSPAAAEISLPSLTRLDLNNNILHNLDDLKVGDEVEFEHSETSHHKHVVRFVRMYAGRWSHVVTEPFNCASLKLLYRSQRKRLYSSSQPSSVLRQDRVSPCQKLETRVL